MKGIILAGGAGTRLHPVTRGVNKHLLPVYNKPMVYYPLSTLMLAGIREILIISTPDALPQFRRLLGDGSQWGLRFAYREQPEPEGIAQALVLGRDFVETEGVGLALGDNIIYGQGLSAILERAVGRERGATVFGYYVSDPSRYGVAELDESGDVVRLVEKPDVVLSHCAIPGLYFYDEQAASIAEGLEPSDRGEYEITDVNREYLRRGELEIELLGRGMAWLDAGTHESLQKASAFIEAIENRQGLKVCCPEEIAYRRGYIDAGELLELAESLDSNGYGAYLRGLLQGETDRVRRGAADPESDPEPVAG